MQPNNLHKINGKHGLPRRKSIRLKGYDYAQAGLYFITTVAQNRACLFGEVVGVPLVGTRDNSKDDDDGGRNGSDENDGQPTSNTPTLILNDAGKMIETQWLALADRFLNIKLHEYIVMPNHFHGIIQIVDLNIGAPHVGACEKLNEIDDNADSSDGEGSDGNDGNDGGRPQGHAPAEQAPTEDAPTEANPGRKTIGDMMDAFKSITTVEYIRGVKLLGWPAFDKKLWQRDYYEHIIRDEESYHRISNYIINNPAKWIEDKFKL